MPFNKLFAIVLCLLCLRAGSQNVEWGNPQKIKQKNLYSQIIGESPSGLYLLRCKDNDFANDVIIEKYKSNLSLELSVPLPLTINGLVERVLLVDNALYVFISARNTQTGKVDLLVQKLDDNLKPTGQPFIVCTIEKGTFIEKRKIQIKTNAEKNKVGIMFLTIGTEPNNSFLNLFCFNSQLQQIYGKQFNLNYTPQAVFITSFDLNNGGDMFMLIDYPKFKDKDDKNDPRKFYLYSYYQRNDKILEYQLDNDSIFIEELGMTVNNFNQSVSVIGFYSEVKSRDLNSYFMKRVSFKTQQVEQSYSGLIDPGVLQKLTATRLERSKQDLNDYYIRKIIPRSDGGVFLVAEKFYQTKQTYTYYVNNFPQTATRVVYNYDEVGLLSFNNDGKIQFTDVIKKRQNSVGDGGYLSSVITFSTTDYIYVVYNSDLDKESDIMVHYTNYQGKSDGKIMIKSNNFNAAVIPGEFKQISANGAIFCTIRDKQFTLMRVTF
ncbi:MAG: hypothetical protein H7296_00050 [Bacteroidia bacterium]|nr:hypothetical protein [Bacteroidia bacterium]